LLKIQSRRGKRKSFPSNLSREILNNIYQCISVVHHFFLKTSALLTLKHHVHKQIVIPRTIYLQSLRSLMKQLENLVHLNQWLPLQHIQRNDISFLFYRKTVPGRSICHLLRLQLHRALRLDFSVCSRLILKSEGGREVRTLIL